MIVAEIGPSVAVGMVLLAVQHRAVAGGMSVSELEYNVSLYSSFLNIASLENITSRSTTCVG